MTCGLDHAEQTDIDRYHAELHAKFNGAAHELWEASTSMRSLLDVIDRALSVLNAADPETRDDVKYLRNLASETHRCAARLSAGMAELDHRYEHLSVILPKVRP